MVVFGLVSAIFLGVASFVFGTMGSVFAGVVVCLAAFFSLGDSADAGDTGGTHFYLEEEDVESRAADADALDAAGEEQDSSLYDEVAGQDTTGQLQRDVDALFPDADAGTKANMGYDLMNSGTKFGDKY